MKMTPIRNSSYKYHMPVAETGDFNALIDNEQPTKKNKRMKNYWKKQWLYDSKLIRLPVFSKTL